MTDESKFMLLLDELERQGGSLLPGPCMPRIIPPLSNPNDPAMTTGCKMERRVSIPDREIVGTAPNVNKGVTIACFTDDRLDLWARFAPMYEEGE